MNVERVVILNSLGHKIKVLRKESGLTQEEFGKKLNIAKSTVSQYENNINVPDISMICKIAELFNVSIDYLVGFNDNKNPYKEEINNKNEKSRYVNDKETTIALHNENGYDENLPPEAKKELDDFIGYLKHKYGKNK